MTEGEARTAALTGGLLPATEWVEVNGLRLRCLVWGAAEEPTAVLVHGNGAHAHWWDTLIPALVPGWRLVAPDLRGHGESSWAEPPSYLMRDFAADLGGVLSALAPGRFALVGHSMGGRIAAWYAAHHPEQVCRLVLLDARLTMVDPREAVKWRGAVSGQREGRSYPTRERALAAFRFVPDEPGVAPEVVRNLAWHAVAERKPGDFTFRFDRAVLSVHGDGERGLEEVVRRIACPTLIMAGVHSGVLGRRAREDQVRRIPGATLAVFPGGHHFLAQGGREVGTTMRRFLDGFS